MKKLAALALLLGIGMLNIGCKPADKPADTTVPDPATAPADEPAADPIPE